MPFLLRLFKVYSNGIQYIHTVLQLLPVATFQNVLIKPNPNPSVTLLLVIPCQYQPNFQSLSSSCRGITSLTLLLIKVLQYACIYDLHLPLNT